jgi:hypothetical protein
LKYVTATYSIFDFLLGLGTHFGTVRDYHKYSLTDVFEIMTQFAQAHYPEDSFLTQLIAIDYYLHFKVKPQALFLDSIPKPEQNRLIEKSGLNYHKFRYVVLPLNFDFNVFALQNKIEEGEHHLIIQYNGVEKAEVINLLLNEQMA